VLEEVDAILYLRSEFVPQQNEESSIDCLDEDAMGGLQKLWCANLTLLVMLVCA
jgi:hypothetical protein